jgi:hypothetical protein
MHSFGCSAPAGTAKVPVGDVELKIISAFGPEAVACTATTPCSMLAGKTQASVPFAKATALAPSGALTARNTFLTLRFAIGTDVVVATEVTVAVRVVRGCETWPEPFSFTTSNATITIANKTATYLYIFLAI